MIGMFVVSWLPYSIMATIGLSKYGDYITPVAAEFPLMIAKASAIWNPLLYSLVHSKYQQALYDRLPPVLRHLYFGLMPCSVERTFH